MDEDQNELSGKILDSTIEVHRNLGPGLLESVYEICLCKEFVHKKLNHIKQTQIPINYKGEQLKRHFRVDILVEEKIIVEVKAIELILPVHKAQLLSYLRLTKLNLGLMINFNVPKLIYGFKRIVN